MRKGFSFVLILAICLGLTPLRWSSTAQVNDPVINEFVFNHTGTDTNEYVEVYGEPSTDYSTLTVLEIEGDGSSTGVIDGVFTVGTTNADGYWTTGFLDNQIENGTVTLLLVEGFTGAASDDLDTDDDGTLDLTPWTQIVDDVAVDDGDAGDGIYSAVALGPNFDGLSSFPPGGASRIPNGVDTGAIADWMRNDFDGEGIPGFTGTPDVGEALNTPDAVNEAVPEPAGNLVINEIDYDQPSTDAAEFVEIKNDGGSAVNLDAYSLELVNGTGGGASVYNTIDLPDVELAAGDYYVVCGDAANVADCDLVVSPSTNLIQNGAPDAVALLFNGEIIDTVSYEGDTGVPYTEGSGAGLEDDPGQADMGISRCPDGADTDQNNTDFVYTAITPGAANSCAAPAGDLVINEIDYDQPSTDAAEFVEVRNNSDASVNLDAYSLELVNGTGGGASVYKTIDLPDVELAAGDYYVVCGDAANVANCDLDVSPDTNLVQNGAPDAVALLFNGEIIDTVSYEGDTGAPYTEGSGSGLEDDSGQADMGISRCSDGNDTDQNNADFVYTAITPGAANDCPLPAIVINEVDADTAGTDTLEFVELYDGGTGNTDLTGMVVVFFNGNGDTSYNAFDLDGFSTDADGYFLLGNSAVVPAPSIVFGNNGLQNGADAVALYVGDAADFSNGTAVTTDNLIDAIVYDTNDSDDAGLLVLLNEGQPQVNEDGAGDKDNHSNQRCPNGEGGARNTDTYAQYAPTPGAENGCAGACGDPATFIHDVQGNGTASPINGASGIVVEGVVVGDFQDTSTELRGFFVQEEDADADADPMTSEGVFVYDSGFGVDVNVGDVVRVQGDVTEYYDLTELNNVSSVAVCSTGSTVTAATITLPIPDLGEWEYAEGMLVTIPGTLYATDNYNLGRYGEVSLSIGERLYNPTNVVEPGTPANDLQALNDRSRILMDDGSNVQNPEPLPPYVGPDNTLRAGDTIPSLTGALSYGFDAYRLHPTEPVVFTRVNERDASPPSVGGTLKVASFNVLNYFTTIDTGDPICGPTGGLDCRGADSEEEFTRQRDKIISAISTMDADVIGLMEMENNATTAIQDLVDGLNAVMGAGTYDFVDTGTIGTDAIKVALIYKPAAVTPVGGFAILDSSVDPTFLDTKNRPVLAQTFEQNATEERFTVAVNHLKSKGSACDDVGDPDTGDGQGNCNLTRTDAAIALTNWLAMDPTGSGDPDFLITGDLNSYAKEDPIDAIKDAGYTNLIETFVGEDAYSYVYFGQSGYLDHALATESLAQQVAGVVEWHINADEPSALDYNNYNQDALYNPDPYRASDHDPVIVSLDLDSTEPLEDMHLDQMRIHWSPLGDGVANFRLQGEFNLPAGYTRDDLSRELKVALTIADETARDVIVFNEYGSVWLYVGPDQAGEGMDIHRARINWLPGRAQITLNGELAMTTVNQNTDPAEATIGLTFPLETPWIISRLVGEMFASFTVQGNWWHYHD